MEQKLLNEILKIDDTFAERLMCSLFVMFGFFLSSFYFIGSNSSVLIIFSIEFIVFMAIVNALLLGAGQQRKLAIYNIDGNLAKNI